MSYKYSKGSTVQGDIKAADDTQRDTLIDFGEDQIDFQTSGSVRLQLVNEGVKVLNGNLSYEDIIMAELSIPGVDLQTDTNAFRFNCPYDLDIIGLNLYLDQHTTAGNVEVTVANGATNMITLVLVGNNLSANTTTVTSGSIDANDQVTFAITATPANAQGLRANLSFKRRI